MWCCQFLSDQLLLTAGADGAVRLWDWRSGEVRAEARAHEKPILSCALSPDRTMLATTSVAGVARLWRLPALEPLRILAEEQDVLHDVAFSPDGRRLATASHDRTVAVYDVASGRRVLQCLGHKARALCLAFSTDGKTIVSGDANGVLRFWQSANAEPLGAIDTGGASIMQILVGRQQPSITIVLDGRAGANAGKMIRWDLGTDANPAASQSSASDANHRRL